MCQTCSFINGVFDSAKTDSLFNYYPILKLLEQIEIQKRIKLFAGDCLIEDVSNVLDSEEHFSVCHYFQCCICKKYIFIGACIRGTPKFEIKDELGLNFSKLLWGKVGSYFENR